jgi:hypothetical protein
MKSSNLPQVTYIVTTKSVTINVGKETVRLTCYAELKKFREARDKILTGEQDKKSWKENAYGILTKIFEKNNHAGKIRKAVNTQNDRPDSKLKLRFKGGVVKNELDEAMPEALSSRITGISEAGKSVDPLMKFWELCKQNPDERAQTDLYNFIMQNKMPITNDGHFIAYRKVKHDFTDCHSGKFDNTPGKFIEMERRHCDANPNQTCSTGLHVAAFEYAKDFNNGRMVIAKVNPKDVVAIPTDYNGQKMRVCKAYIVAEYKQGKPMEIDLYDENSVKVKPSKKK